MHRWGHGLWLVSLRFQQQELPVHLWQGWGDGQDPRLIQGFGLSPVGTESPWRLVRDMQDAVATHVALELMTIASATLCLFQRTQSTEHQLLTQGTRLQAPGLQGTWFEGVVERAGVQETRAPGLDPPLASTSYGAWHAEGAPYSCCPGDTRFLGSGTH